MNLKLDELLTTYEILDDRKIIREYKIKENGDYYLSEEKTKRVIFTRIGEVKESIISFYNENGEIIKEHKILSKDATLYVRIKRGGHVIKEEYYTYRGKKIKPEDLSTLL